MEKNIKKIESIIEQNNTNIDFKEKIKNYKKGKLYINKSNDLIKKYEDILESNDLNDFKNNHSINDIDKNLNNDVEDIQLNTLFEYLASIQKIKALS